MSDRPPRRDVGIETYIEPIRDTEPPVRPRDGAVPVKPIAPQHPVDKPEPHTEGNGT